MKVQSAHRQVPMQGVLVLLPGLLGIVLAGEAIPRQVNGQPEIPTGTLLGAMRTLNTTEVSCLNDNGRFADRDQMLAYLRQQGYRGNKSSPIDFENPQPYELMITTNWERTALPDFPSTVLR